MASHLFKRGALILVAFGLCLSSACVSSKYKQADKRTPPAKALNVKFPPAILDASLYTQISDGAPGSWKRESYWDEYVVTIHNPGDQPLEITSATLTDYAEAPHAAGDNPWALERESKTLEKRYQDAGIAFARVAAPESLLAPQNPGWSRAPASVPPAPPRRQPSQPWLFRYTVGRCSVSTCTTRKE